MLRPELPGGLAAALALILAVKPSLASGVYQNIFIAAALICGAWFVIAFLRNAVQGEKDYALQVASKAMLYSQKLYNLIAEVRRAEYVTDGTLNQTVIAARNSAEQDYANLYRLEILHFLRDMTRKDVWDDREALALATNMETGNASVEQIEELAAMLNGISDDIFTYEKG